jgi:dipeptidyl-peptidase-4
MPVFDRFVAARREALPTGYLIPPHLGQVVDLLRHQGVLVDRLMASGTVPAQTFAVDSLAVGPVFEGHRTVQVEGHWSTRPVDTTFAPGWFLVRTDQPLGVLAAYLIEPASEDGIVTWNLLDRELQPRTGYPIMRVGRLPGAPTVAIP